jgi:hypothetical protein
MAVRKIAKESNLEAQLKEAAMRRFEPDQPWLKSGFVWRMNQGERRIGRFDANSRAQSYVAVSDLFELIEEDASASTGTSKLPRYSLLSKGDNFNGSSFRVSTSSCFDI